MSTTASVVITAATPHRLDRCLERLAALQTRLQEIVVVDTTDDDRISKSITEASPNVMLLRAPRGRATTEAPCLLGFRATTGDVVAFVDGNDEVDPEWLDELLEPYSSQRVVGVGARVALGSNDPAAAELSSIGRLLPNGELTRNFSANPGRQIDVDHLAGAVVSLRRSAVACVGTVDGSHPTTCLCEGAAISLLLKNAGGILVFRPTAVVSRTSAETADRAVRRGNAALFSYRRDHLTLLVRAFGTSAELVRRYAATTLRQQSDHLRTLRHRVGPRHADGRRRSWRKRLTTPVVLLRPAAELAGLLAGVPTGVLAYRRDRRAPRPVLVRHRDIECTEPPAGQFRSVAVDQSEALARAASFIGTYCVDTSDRVYAVTYDDGPNPASTPAVLDVLAEHDAVATFFVLSAAAAEHPALLRRIVDEGHEVALHGVNHQSLLTMSTRQAGRQISQARATVEEIIGQPVRLYRPPYGAHNLRQARMVQRLGLELTIWSGDAEDWIDDTVENVADRALGKLFAGSVLLLHDARADPETLRPGERLPAFDRAAVLDRILRSAAETGFRTMTASTMFASYPRVLSMARQRMQRARTYVETGKNY